MVLTHCVARTRGALQPAAPRTMRSRAAGAFHSTFANHTNFAIIIIVIIIIIIICVVALLWILFISEPCGFFPLGGSVSSVLFCTGVDYFCSGARTRELRHLTRINRNEHAS